MSDKVEQGRVFDLIKLTDSVKAGMVWLDKHYPDHVERFNPEAFHIWKQCALIQASGLSWHPAMLKHPELEGPYCLRSRELGFVPNAIDSLDVPSRSIPWHEFREMIKQEEELYNLAWLQAYAQRRNEGGAA